MQRQWFENSGQVKAPEFWFSRHPWAIQIRPGVAVQAARACGTNCLRCTVLKPGSGCRLEGRSRVS